MDESIYAVVAINSAGIEKVIPMVAHSNQEVKEKVERLNAKIWPEFPILAIDMVVIRSEITEQDWFGEGSYKVLDEIREWGEAHSFKHIIYS